MNQSPSWEANSCSATQEIIPASMVSKVNYRVHKSPPLVPFLTQINPTKTSYIFKNHFNIIPHLRLGLSSDLFPSSTSIKTFYVLSFAVMHSTYSAHLIFLELIILIIFGEDRELVRLWAYDNIQNYTGRTLALDILRINLSKEYPRRQHYSDSSRFTVLNFYWTIQIQFILKYISLAVYEFQYIFGLDK
jgi:hypothetical protein